jgi:integrase
MLCRSCKSVNTVKNYVSGVKLLHILLEQPCVGFDNVNLKLALKGMTRMKSHTLKQALPITKEILLKIYRELNFNDVTDVVFWSLFLLAFFTMSRKSNLVVTVGHALVKCLTRADVIVGETSLLVNFRWSKTNQFGSRIHRIPLPRLLGSPLCPVRAYKVMCSRLSVKADQPAFCIWKGTKVAPVTYDDLQKFLRVQVAKLGLNPEHYSSHSFRRGAASLAFRSGVHTNLIQALGDWSSDAYKNYVTVGMLEKINAVNKMYNGS